MAGNGESSAATGEHRYVALLRGVNVGGRNKLPMADLKDLFAAAGCAAVRTYIQSGNVVFDAAHDLAEAVPEIVTLAIRRRFGYETAVVARSGEEVRQVVTSSPSYTWLFSRTSRVPRRYLVSTQGVRPRTSLWCEGATSTCATPTA